MWRGPKKARIQSMKKMNSTITNKVIYEKPNWMEDYVINEDKRKDKMGSK